MKANKDLELLAKRFVFTKPVADWKWLESHNTRDQIYLKMIRLHGKKATKRAIERWYEIKALMGQ